MSESSYWQQKHRAELLDAENEVLAERCARSERALLNVTLCTTLEQAQSVADSALRAAAAMDAAANDGVEP